MAINIIRFYHFISLIFLLINLDNLIYDSFSVKYIEKEFNRHELTLDFWVCTEFYEIKVKSEGNFPKLLSKRNRNEVTIREILNETIKYLSKTSIQFKLMLNKTHLFNKQFCFSVQCADFEKGHLNDYLSIYDVKFYGFSHDILPMNYKSLYIKKAGDPEMINLKNHQQKIMNSKKPNAYLECIIKKQNKKHNNFNCLKNCFKKSTSLDVYFDFDDYDKKIDLNTIFNKDYNSSNSYIVFCLNKCKSEDCYWETHNSITLNSVIINVTKVQNSQLLIETEPILLEFWTNFFGLVTLFTGTSLFQSLPILLKYVSKFVNKEEFIKRYILYIKFTLIVFSLIFLINRGIILLEEHYESLEEPSKTINLNFSIEPSNYSVVICIPIQFLIRNAQILNEDNDQSILRTKTFGEIEKLTNDGLEKVVNNIYLKYGSEKRIQNYKVSKKVIFRNSSTYLQYDTLVYHLQRCFYIKPDLQMPRYETMMAIANLLIEFKNEFYELFIIGAHLDLSSDDLSYHESQFKITKFSKIRSLNCTDYFANKVCTSRQKCIERCILKLFFKKYSKIPTSAKIIVKDNFHDLEREPAEIKLNISGRIESKIEESYFSMQFDSEIEKKCAIMFKDRDCITIKFPPSFKKGTSKESKLEREIEFYHEKETETEISSTFMSAFLTIVNLESILFGSNIPSTMLILFSILKSFFKLKWRSTYKYLIFLTCIIGFSVHLFFIFHEIIIEVLVDAGSFERKDKLQLPSLVFCFSIFQFNRDELDENYLQSGEYLDRFTKNLTFNKIFDKILYYDKSKFVNLNLTLVNETENNLAKIVDLDYFYFNNLKCFKIKVIIDYDEEDFYFKKDVYSVKLFFNQRFKSEDFYFFYKNKHSRQLIEIYRFNLTNFKYKIKLELFEIEIIDKFEVLKNPLRLLFKENNINDGNHYLTMITNDFKNKFNLSSQLVPLLRESFQTEINDKLFHQFYFQIQDPIDRQYPSSKNSKRTMYNCYEQRFYSLAEEPDLAFGIDFQARIVKVTNELNFGKLLQNILNR